MQVFFQLTNRRAVPITVAFHSRFLTKFEFSFLNANLIVRAGPPDYVRSCSKMLRIAKARINGTHEHHALIFLETRRKTMTSKSKLFLIAAVAAATLASPAFAQTTTQSTHQERTLRSDQAPAGSNMYDGSQGDPSNSYYPGDN
jgi:hypothetical protein